MGLFDGYQRGAASAKADGGENKLTARALEEFARNGFGLMPGAQNREDEFRRGYSETYETIARDAQRNVPVQVTSQSTSHVTATDFIQSTQGDFTMATNQNIEQSIELLHEMGRIVRTYKDALADARVAFENKIKDRVGEGMDATVNQFYENHVVDVSQQIKSSEDYLMDKALPKLWDIIQALKNLPKV